MKIDTKRGCQEVAGRLPTFEAGLAHDFEFAPGQKSASTPVIHAQASVHSWGRVPPFKVEYMP